MIPKKLEDWSYKEIEGLIDRNICESEIHDFKYDMPDATNLTKICCAFANTKGGFIILGVKDHEKKFIIEGIEPDKELSHKFGAKLKPVPTIYFELPKIIDIPNPDKKLAIFHIPLSPERPHSTVVDHKTLFYKRTNRGNVLMSYEEIKMAFQNYQERFKKIHLLYVELLAVKELLLKIKTGYASAFIIIDLTIITNLLVDLFDIIAGDKKLLRNLIKIRYEITEINLRINSFFLSPSKESISSNYLQCDFIKEKAVVVDPLIQETITNLEKNYNLKDPFIEN